MKTIETNAASTPAITKFEVGKTYVARPDVDFELNMTVVKRTNCYVSFIIEDGEIDETVYKRKVANICGVEKICYRETNAIIREYEFSAKNEVATGEVKVNEVASTPHEIIIGDETVKFFNGKFHSVFSRKYHGAIVNANGIISYCVFNDGDTEIYDVSGHEVSYDEFIATLEERAKTDEVTDTVNGKREDLTTAAICLQSGHTLKGDVELVNEHGDKGDTASEVDRLERQFHDVQSKLDKRITVKIQGGVTCAIDKDSDIRLTKIKDGYAFVDYGEIVAPGAKVVLGHYDTPAQVKEVIKMFGKSIDGGRFEFPHVDDVDKSTVELAEELTAFLLKITPWRAGFMDLTLQDGRTTAASPRTATVEPDWHGNGRFVFITPWNEIFARYDTPEQVRTVIYRIKHAIDDKRDKFKYPTVEEIAPPAYDLKTWAVDFDIYHADSDLTDAELESYTDRLRKAMTTDGNVACAELEDSVIAIYGDSDGDTDTVKKIVGEMYKRGCWVEYPEDEPDDANEKARLG